MRLVSFAAAALVCGGCYSFLPATRPFSALAARPDPSIDFHVADLDVHPRVLPGTPSPLRLALVVNAPHESCYSCQATPTFWCQYCVDDLQAVLRRTLVRALSQYATITDTGEHDAIATFTLDTRPSAFPSQGPEWGPGLAWTFRLTDASGHDVVGLTDDAALRLTRTIPQAAIQTQIADVAEKITNALNAAHWPADRGPPSPIPPAPPEPASRIDPALLATSPVTLGTPDPVLLPRTRTPLRIALDLSGVPATNLCTSSADGGLGDTVPGLCLADLRRPLSEGLTRAMARYGTVTTGAATDADVVASLAIDAFDRFDTSATGNLEEWVVVIGWHFALRDRAGHLLAGASGTSTANAERNDYAQSTTANLPGLLEVLLETISGEIDAQQWPPPPAAPSTPST